jgi:hypothetical protein
MNQKTSTAALDSFGEEQLANRRRVPRHPVGGRGRSKEVKEQRRNEKAKEFAQAQILVRQGGGMTGGRARTDRRLRLLLPVILRISCSLVLWTLGAATMTLGENLTCKYRATHEFSATP